MLKTLISYGLGVYTGIYIAQNYQIDKVDDPNKLWDRFTKYVEDLAEKKKEK